MIYLLALKAHEELFNENINLRKENAILKEKLSFSRDKERSYRRRLIKAYEGFILKMS